MRAAAYAAFAAVLEGAAAAAAAEAFAEGPDYDDAAGAAAAAQEQVAQVRPPTLSLSLLLLEDNGLTPSIDRSISSMNDDGAGTDPTLLLSFGQWTDAIDRSIN